MFETLPPPHTTYFRIYYGDTDAGGVMYHAAYIDVFARARNEWCRDHGLSIPVQKAGHFCFVVRKLSSTFYRPALLDDWIEIQTTLRSFSPLKAVFHQAMFREGILLCEAEIEVVCVDVETLKPKRIRANEKKF